MTTIEPGVPGWVQLTEEIRFSNGWLALHAPDLYAAWVRADRPRERRSVAARILRAAADVESDDDPTGGGVDPAMAVWTDLAERLDPRLTAGPDWWPLAAALTRVDATGYDVGARLPALAGAAALPARHPARELHFRLLDDCHEASQRALGRPIPPSLARPGHRR